jgi:DNA polymerase III delta prime subunit
LPALPRQGTLHLDSQIVQFMEATLPQWVAQATHPRVQISGPAGIGKTTLLLELAAEILQQAQQDPTRPLPVLFHLASWDAEAQALEDWLRLELQVKYGVSRSLAHHWLAANRLLPMLDGFDELAPHRHEAAILALNAWLSQPLRPLVICCGGHDTAPSPNALAIPTHLRLEPLTPVQVEAYLTALQQDALWVELQRWPAWLPLAQIPLWLNLLIVTHSHFDPADWNTDFANKAQQNTVLDRFIQRQLHHPITLGSTPKYPIAAQTMRHWLSWLARHINEQAEHEFSIDGMQPNLLSNRRQTIQYTVLGGLLFGLMGGLVFGLFIGPGSGIFVLSCITSLFILRRGDDAIDPLHIQADTIGLMRFIFVRQINYLVIFALITGLLVAVGEQGVVGGIVILLVGMLAIILARATVALPSWLLGSLVAKVNRYLESDILVHAQPNQGIQSALLYLLRTTVIFLPFLLFLKVAPLIWFSLLPGPTPIEMTTFIHILKIIGSITLWATIFDSALVCAQHCALRLVLFKANAIPWNYARFLDTCCEHHLLQRVGRRYQFVHPLLRDRWTTL